MAELDIRKLGVTLRSTSGTIAFANEIYDEAQEKFQSAINEDIYSKISDASDSAGEKVASVQGENAIEVDSTTATSPKVKLKLDNTGNVSLSQGTEGLKAEVTIPTLSVKAGEKILSVNGHEVSSTLALEYDKAAKIIKLIGKGTDTNNIISSFSTADFVKDGLVSNAELIKVAEQGVTEQVPYIKLTFNSDGGDPIRFSVKDLVDVYDGANLKLSSSYGTATASAAPTAGASLDAVVKYFANELANIAGTDFVNTFGGQTGAITLKNGGTSNGDINLTMNGKQLQASIVGLGTAAYTASTAYATAAQGTTADNAVQSLTILGQTLNKTSNSLTVAQAKTALGLGSAAYTESTAYATATQGGYADSALQEVKKSTTKVADYVELDITTKTGNDGAKEQTIGIQATMQAMATASTTKKGLAEASDVKSYVDGEISKVNNANYGGVTHGTDGAYVTVTVGTKTTGNNPTQAISASVTTKNVADATAQSNGLAVASDVKSYVDNAIEGVNSTIDGGIGGVEVGTTEYEDITSILDGSQKPTERPTQGPSEEPPLA